MSLLSSHPSSLLASFEGVVGIILFDVSHVIYPDSPVLSLDHITSRCLFFLLCLFQSHSGPHPAWASAIAPFCWPHICIPTSELSPEFSLLISKHLMSSSTWQNPKILKLNTSKFIIIPQTCLPAFSVLVSESILLETPASIFTFF